MPRHDSRPDLARIPTLDSDEDTPPPPAHKPSPETPEEGSRAVKRRRPIINLSTDQKFSISIGLLIAGAIALWKTSSDVTLMKAQIKITAAYVRVLARKQGITTVDLLDQEKDSDGRLEIDGAGK